MVNKVILVGHMAAFPHRGGRGRAQVCRCEATSGRSLSSGQGESSGCNVVITMPEDASAWFAARIPAGWFVGPPEVVADGEEILVLGTLADVGLAGGTSQAAHAAARSARIERFREET